MDANDIHPNIPREGNWNFPNVEKKNQLLAQFLEKEDHSNQAVTDPLIWLVTLAMLLSEFWGVESRWTCSKTILFHAKKAPF